MSYLRYIEPEWGWPCALYQKLWTSGNCLFFCNSNMSSCESVHISFISTPNEWLPSALYQTPRSVSFSVNSRCLHANPIMSALYRTRMGASALHQNPWEAGYCFFFCYSNMSSCESAHISFISNPNGWPLSALYQNPVSVSFSVASMCLHVNPNISPLYRTRREEAGCSLSESGHD